MYIRRLNLTNVRQFGSKPLTFQPGFNLIVGENGAGKSTVLRSIMTALKASGNFKRTDRLFEDDIKHRMEELQIEIELRDGDTQKTVSYTHNWLGRPTHREKPSNIPAIWFGANEASTRSFRSKKVRHYSREGRKRYWDSEFRYREEFLLDLMHPEFDEPSKEERERKLSRSEDVRRFVGEALSAFSHKFSRFAWRLLPYDCVLKFPESKIHNKAVTEEFRRIVQGEIMRFLEYDYPPRRYRGWGSEPIVRYNVEGRPLDPKDKRIRSMHEFGEIVRRAAKELQVSSVGEAVIELKLDYRIIVFGPDGPFYLNQLSDGEKRIFSMVVDIAQQLMGKSENWREIGKRSACILIDEIDCHLHPKWQRMIVGILEDLFPACQFIATTHSPFVIQAMNRHKIVLLGTQRTFSPDPLSNSIEDIVEEIQGIALPQRSLRAERLSTAAHKYFKLLKNKGRTPPESLDTAEREYREASEPYTLEPAAHALLKIQKLEAENK